MTNLKNCAICGREFKPHNDKIICCSKECSDKNKSKIYNELKSYKKFEDMPESILKSLKKYDRNRVLPQIKKFFPFYDDFKDFWDNYKVCKCCGDLFKRSSAGKRSLEVCDKRKCVEFYNSKMDSATNTRKKTCNKKYGVDSYSKTEEFFSKVKPKNPFLDYSWQLNNITGVQKRAGGYDKWIERQRSNSSKYQNSLSVDDKKQQTLKREQTTFERYGVKNVFEMLDTTSKSETKFLDELELKLDLKIRRQFKVKRFKVDGFIEPNIIIEFLGDYWHGKQNDNTLNEKIGKTFKELRDETFERFKKLKELGYEIQYIWESDFEKIGIEGLRKYE